MNYLKLTCDALDIKNISDIASSESCGALSMFVGMTRNSFGGKEVLSLEYEAYEPMAFNQLELICGDIRRRWTDIVNIAIYHRVGLVAIKEASVVIAISSPHRESSLHAVSFAIDELKKRVPIWKKEIYKEEEAVWKANKESGVGSSGKINLFNDSLCCIQDSLILPTRFIQISASENEINKRIQCFIENKRVEINVCNNIDFTGVNRKYNPLTASLLMEDNDDGNKSMTCARINSFVVKQDCSKCHLKVRRVENNIGPQTRPNYLNTLDKLMVPIQRKNSGPYSYMLKKEKNQTLFSSEESSMLKYPAILERIENIEELLSVPESRVDVFQRLKVIEDRLLSLESISPEYVHCQVKQSQNKKSTDTFEFGEAKKKTTGFLIHEKKPYSVGKISSIIHSCEKRKNFKY